jgi:hypothetical protein
MNRNEITRDYAPVDSTDEGVVHNNDTTTQDNLDQNYNGSMECIIVSVCLV